MIIAVASILYGSIMAFTQTNVRLILGYSSIAQLGFITLGIFSLRPDGADGAVIQMFNHGLVVAAAFFVIAILYARTETEDLREMGGMAKRAPILAILFVIVTMATLAIPGSANFVGEFFILSGAFESKVALALIASVGHRAGRLLRAAHVPADDAQPAARGHDLARDLAARGASCWCRWSAASSRIAFYPGLITTRGEASVDRSLSALGIDLRGAPVSPRERRWRSR